jgi:hypothetical protein
MPFTSAEDVADTELPLIVNIWGEEKTGKTSMALTFPRPLYLFDFDHGFKELLLKHPEYKKDLFYQTYHLPANPSLDQGETELQRFVDDWYEACNDPNGTVVLDTATDLKSLVTFVKMSQKLEEKLKKLQSKTDKKVDPDTVQLMRPDYAPRNELMRAILSLPAVAEKHAVFIWKAKEKYSGNGAATGQYEGDLFKDAPYIAQATLGRKRIGLGKNISFVTTLDTNRFDPTMNGSDFPEDVVAGYEDLRGILV